jgi:hypothetical protein
MNILRRQIASVLVVMVSLSVCPTQGAERGDTIHLTGVEVSAVMIAAADFKEKHASVSGYPRHYTVEVERHGGQLEVVFIPNQPPLGPNEAGTGGGNIYGPEVAYFVSLSRLKIVRFHFAR